MTSSSNQLLRLYTERPLCCREPSPARTFSDDQPTSTTDDEVIATLCAELKNWSQQVYSIPLNPESGLNKIDWKTEATFPFYIYIYYPYI